MSKNLIRKGLAVVSVAALGMTGLSVLPASAAGQADTTFVSLVPNTGSAYAVMATETFSLKSNQSSPVTSTGRDLKWLVTDADSVSEPLRTSTLAEYTIADDTTVVANGTTTVRVNAANVASALTTGDVIEFTANFAVADNAAGDNSVNAASADTRFTVTVAEDKTYFTFTSNQTPAAAKDTVNGAQTIRVIRSARDTDGSYVVDTGLDTNTSNKVLVLDNTGTDSESVTVTAWVDDNGNDVIDTTEYVSPTRTVQFVAAADLTGTVSYDPVVLGDSDITAYVTTTPALNGAQSSADVEVGFTYQGSSVTDYNNASFDAATGTWVANSDAIGGGVIAGSYSVTPAYNGTAIGPKVTIGIGARVASEATGSAVETANINVYDNDTNDPELEIRAGTLTAVATYSVVDADGNAIGAGKAVRVETTGGTLPTGAKLNGVAITAGKVFDLTTDSKGQLTLTVTATAAAAGKSVYFDVRAEGLSATEVDFDFDWYAAEYDLHELNNDGSDAYAEVDSDYARSVAVGGTHTFNFAFVDQWAQGPQTGSYRLNVVTSGRTVSEKNYPMGTNGRVTVSVGDDQVGSGSYIDVDVEPEKQLTNGTWSDSESEVSGEGITWVIWPAAQTGGTVTLDDDEDNVDLALIDLVAGDGRVSQDDITEAHSGDDHYDLSGTVTDSVDGTYRKGARVTVTAPSSVMISDGYRSAFGSLTLFADEDGDFGVSLTSNRSQKDAVITVSSMGGTDTFKLTVNNAEADTAVAATVSAPKSVKAGRTMVYTVTLVDEYGNPVITDTTATGYNAGDTTPSVAVSYSGPGLVTTDIATKTNASGQIRVSVLVGTLDTGVASFTASYDSNGSTADVAGTTIVFSNSSAVWVGPIANAKAGAKKGNVVVEAYRAKGKTVSVFVGGTRVASFVADKANDSMVVKGIKSGTRNVRVTLSGPGEDFRGAVTVK